jgi:hypothetical protein
MRFLFKKKTEVVLNISDRLVMEEYHGKQIIYVDYKGLKEAQMIALINKHLELALEIKLPFVADYNNTFVTPGYMLHARNFVNSTKEIISRGAFLGSDTIKASILKGVASMYGVDYRSFESKEEAIFFLTQPK